MPGCKTAGMAFFACFLAQTLFAADLAERPAPPLFDDGDTLVLAGDDVTQQALYSQYLEDFFLTRFPGKTIRVINAGVQGSQAQDVLQRLSTDVAAHQPTHVAVCLGLNDGGVQPFREDLFVTFRRDLTELDRRIRDLHAVPIYLSPPMFDAKSARIANLNPQPEGFRFYNATLAYYGAWLRDFAADSPAPFVDLHGSLNRLTREARLRQPDFTFLPDGMHPNPAGQLVIAATFLAELGWDRPLSEIHIDHHPMMLAATAEGGTVRNLQATAPGTISFLWEAAALPWSVPADTQPAGALLELADRFNREVLQIRGLAAGNYELLIDGRLIDRFSHEQWDAGISLQQFSTPQSEQSVRVAQGNRERTEAVIRPAREEWSLQQERSRLVRRLADQPENLDLQRKLAKLEQKLEGFAARQEKLAQAAEEWLGRLRETAQPATRQFLIRPVLTSEVHGRVLLGGVPISGAIVELHGLGGLTAAGRTDAMGFYQLTANLPDGIPPGDGWLVVLAKMVLPKFISLEQSGHRVMLRSGINEIELYFEETPGGE
jgi:lysophospholipase L1-like esterase